MIPGTAGTRLSLTRKMQDADSVFHVPCRIYKPITVCQCDQRPWPNLLSGKRWVPEQLNSKSVRSVKGCVISERDLHQEDPWYTCRSIDSPANSTCRWVVPIISSCAYVLRTLNLKSSNPKLIPVDFTSQFKVSTKRISSLGTDAHLHCLLLFTNFWRVAPSAEHRSSAE